MPERSPLYGKNEADSLRIRESLRDSDRVRHKLIMEHVPPCRRLVDVGCGWGQLLGLLQNRVEELWGVDESPHRVADVAQACPAAKVVVCRADRLKLPDGYFDVAITSQMLHEVKLFGAEGELARTLCEISRVLVRGGRYLLLDHQDAGDGEVVVCLPAEQMPTLDEFEQKFRLYEARHEADGHANIRISRRCLQDFLTKDWSLRTSMESMEMNETHNVFRKQETVKLVSEAGLTVRRWVDFSSIGDDLSSRGGALVEGQPWERKFLLVAEKT